MTLPFSEHDIETLVGIFPEGCCRDASSSGGSEGIFSLGCELNRRGLVLINESDDEERRLDRGVKK